MVWWSEFTLKESSKATKTSLEYISKFLKLAKESKCMVCLICYWWREGLHPAGQAIAGIHMWITVLNLPLNPQNHKPSNYERDSQQQVVVQFSTALIDHWTMNNAEMRRYDSISQLAAYILNQVCWISQRGSTRRVNIIAWNMFRI